MNEIFITQFHKLIDSDLVERMHKEISQVIINTTWV